MMVADRQTAPVTEWQSVVAWRAISLVRAGYPSEQAFLLAERGDIDLHQAVDLVAKGCPVDVAVRILT